MGKQTGEEPERCGMRRQSMRNKRRVHRTLEESGKSQEREQNKRRAHRMGITKADRDERRQIEEGY